MPGPAHTKKIVVCGGSFNPPHLGHAIMIEKTLRLFPCDEFWIMPSGDRHDKNISISAEHRIKMLECMLHDLFPTAEIPIRISTIETERPKPTTTYDTKCELETTYPENLFYFLVGTENLPFIEKHWVNGAKLLATARFVAIPRPGTPKVEKLPDCLELVLLPEEEGAMQVSSTFLRSLTMHGKPLLPYVSTGVAQYIGEHGLYNR
jgi:nicotinate-nucleotide adenylyltransferase